MRTFADVAWRFASRAPFEGQWLANERALSVAERRPLVLSALDEPPLLTVDSIGVCGDLHVDCRQVKLKLNGNVNCDTHHQGAKARRRAATRSWTKNGACAHMSAQEAVAVRWLAASNELVRIAACATLSSVAERPVRGGHIACTASSPRSVSSPHALLSSHMAYPLPSSTRVEKASALPHGVPLIYPGTIAGPLWRSCAFHP